MPHYKTREEWKDAEQLEAEREDRQGEYENHAGDIRSRLEGGNK